MQQATMNERERRRDNGEDLVSSTCDQDKDGRQLVQAFPPTQNGSSQVQPELPEARRVLQERPWAHTAGGSMREYKQDGRSNLQLSQRDHRYPTYQTAPQELPQRQVIDVQLKTCYAQSFGQQGPDEPAPDQKQNLTPQTGLNDVLQGPFPLNYISVTEVVGRMPVVCPMGALPNGACPWRGEFRFRNLHISTDHKDYLFENNFIKMSPNCVAVLNAYTEYFLCYTATISGTDKLYCIVQHACITHDCVLSYQYKCEVYAENPYEKISITRLVGHLKDDFITLTQTGKCVTLDSAVVKYFTFTDGFYIDIKVLIPEPV